MVGMLQESSGVYALIFIAFLIGIRLVPMVVNRLRSKKDGEVLEKVHAALERNTEALLEVTHLLNQFAHLRNGRASESSGRADEPADNRTTLAGSRPEA